MGKKSQKAKLYNAEEGYNQYANIYEKDVPFLNTFEKDVVFEMLGIISGKNVLDAGCGTGRSAEFLARFGANVAGFDLSEKMIEICRKKFPSKDFKVGSIENIPFDDDYFDLAISTFVIVHLKDLSKAFDELYRVLKPGGELIVTNINQRKPPKLETSSGDFIIIESFYHRPEDVISSLENSFFEICDEKYVFEGKTWINQIVKCKKG